MIKSHFVVLAGGASHRYGKDKMLGECDSMTFLARKVKEIRKLRCSPAIIYLSLNSPSQIPTIIQSLNPHYTVHYNARENNEIDVVDKDVLTENFTLKIIFDSKFTDCAPSSGLIQKKRAVIFALHRIFNEIRDGFIFLTSIDTPLFGMECMNLMQVIMEEALTNNEYNFDAFIPQWTNGFIEPLHGLYRIDSFKQIIGHQILKRNYKITHLLEINGKVNYISIERIFGQIGSNLNFFTNHNKPAKIKVNLRDKEKKKK